MKFFEFFIVMCLFDGIEGIVCWFFGDGDGDGEDCVLWWWMWFRVFWCEGRSLI